MKITDVLRPLGARRYRAANISRFQHGWLLLRMRAVAFRKFKVDPVRV